MKVKTLGEGVICYVTKLNRSDDALPQAFLNDKTTVGILSAFIIRHLSSAPNDMCLRK